MKKPVKKNRRINKKPEFPTVFNALILRRALFITAVSLIVIAFAWVISTALTGFSVEAADIFAVFSLITLSLAVLVLLLVAVEKLTGRSWLNGLEFIGKHTVGMFELIYTNTLDFIGVENKKTNRRVKSRETNSSKKLDIIHADRQQAETVSSSEPIFNEQLASLATENNNEPSLGFAKTSAAVVAKEEISTGDDLFQNSFANFTSTEVASKPIKPVGINTRESEGISHVDDLLDELLSDDELSHSELEIIKAKEFELSSLDDELVLEELNSNRLEAEQEQENTELEPDHLYEENPFSDEPYFEEQLDSNDHAAILQLNDNEQPDLSNVEESVSLSKNNSFSDLSQNNLMGSSKQKDEAISNEGDVFQFSSASSMLEQAKQETDNIISGLQPVFNSEQQEASYTLPDLSLLDIHEQSIRSYSEEELAEMSRTVESVLLDYKVSVEVQGAYPGPVITRFELALAPGVKVSRVSGLAKDLARAMRVTSVRVVEIIAGTSFVGLEIPNQERELVSFREIIASEEFQTSKSPLTLSLGKDVSGKTVVSDLGKMPHVLVAGTTGSGKSVAINTMILSMLFKATPDQVRLIMIDPKMLELSVYEGIPHLLTPVVTDMKEAQSALRWAVAEMERRYKLMSKVGVRNLAGYNQKIDEAAERGESIRDPLFQLTKPLEEGESFPTLEKLPHIVIVIDELADMMMIVGKKVEELIARLAQKARAAGIHLILATQRPSVDVLTGLIKANVPTRISFQVSSRIDSRTILDQGGAEALLGNGDMLFLPSGTSIPIRAHGAFVDDPEVHQVVEYLKTQGAVQYLTDIIQAEPTDSSNASSAAVDETDALYNDALDFVYDTNKASISSLQRRFKIGYNRAARMIDQMEEENIVSQPEGNGSRSVIRRD